METHTSTTTATYSTPASRNETTEFIAGATVIYALHGKCQLVSIETRQIKDQAIRFYKLAVQKSALSRSTRQEPAIWLPVSSACERGLRIPVDKDTSKSVIEALTNREYYFQTNEPWSVIQPKVEASIRNEGAIGLAKAMSYLHVLKKKLVVLPSEIVRFQETVQKLLFRELSEALGEPIRILEERVAKGMRQKLIPDN